MKECQTQSRTRRLNLGQFRLPLVEGEKTETDVRETRGGKPSSTCLAYAGIRWRFSVPVPGEVGQLNDWDSETDRVSR